MITHLSKAMAFNQVVALLFLNNVQKTIIYQYLMVSDPSAAGSED